MFFNAIPFQIRSEGIGKLYRGLLPPLIMRTSSRALMFGLYDEFCHKMKVTFHSISLGLELYLIDMPPFSNVVFLSNNFHCQKAKIE